MTDERLREALIPLATRYADHLLHPERHPAIRDEEPTDDCWIDLYRAIIGLQPLAATPETPPLDDCESRTEGFCALGHMHWSDR